MENQTQLFEGARTENPFTVYQRSLLQHSHSRLGAIPNPAAEMEAVKWLFKANHPVHLCIRFFDMKLQEMKTSSKTFRISWQLVKSQIGSWLAVAGLSQSAPASSEISTALKSAIEALDSIEEYVDRGYAAFNALEPDAQDGLVMEKIDSFKIGLFARQFSHMTDEQITDRAIYEIAKELAR